MYLLYATICMSWHSFSFASLSARVSYKCVANTLQKNRAARKTLLSSGGGDYDDDDCHADQVFFLQFLIFFFHYCST